MKIWKITATTRIIFLLALLMPMASPAQDYYGQQGKAVSVRGYLKSMQTINFVEGADSIWTDNLIHNRLIFRWYASSNLELRMDLRNRIFYGDLVRIIPNYSDFIDGYNDYFDLSTSLIDSRSLVFHSMIDRLYLQWKKGKFEATVGRQRINWGINLAWNPNDIFNAYSFFDFDYEERPGSDAVRLQYFTGFASSIELAANLADNIDEWIAAGLWKFNRWNYDFQVLGGVAEGDVSLGGGWAGVIGEAGFKGEFTYFSPFIDAEQRENVFTASVAFDYSFKNSLYLYSSYLFNNQAGGGDINLLDFTQAERLSPKNLLPFKHSLLAQVTYPFHPLMSGGLAAMVFPAENGGIFLNPNFTYSISENWDLDLIGQLFYTTGSDGQNAAANVIYWRLKWSF